MACALGSRLLSGDASASSPVSRSLERSHTEQTFSVDGQLSVRCHLGFPRFFQNQLSWYLLRKFRNSHGWQKLWVVFTNLFVLLQNSPGRGVAPERTAEDSAPACCPLPISTNKAGVGGLLPFTKAPRALSSVAHPAQLHTGETPAEERPALPSRTTTPWPASHCWATVWVSPRRPTASTTSRSSSSSSSHMSASSG